MVLGPIPVILIQQTYFLDNSLGVPDGPDPQEAILGSCVLQGEVRSDPSIGTGSLDAYSNFDSANIFLR